MGLGGSDDITFRLTAVLDMAEAYDQARAEAKEVGRKIGQEFGAAASEGMNLYAKSASGASKALGELESGSFANKSAMGYLADTTKQAESWMDLFSRQTHKAATLLHMMGGSAGNAASMIIRLQYMVGSLVTNLSGMTLGIIGLVAGLVTLGAKLYDLATGPMARTTKAMEELNKKAAEAHAAFLKMVDDSTYKRLSEHQRKMITMRGEEQDLMILMRRREMQAAETAVMTANSICSAGRSMEEWYDIILKGDEAYQGNRKALAALRGDMESLAKMIREDLSSAMMQAVRAQAEGFSESYRGKKKAAESKWKSKSAEEKSAFMAQKQFLGSGTEAASEAEMASQEAEVILAKADALSNLERGTLNYADAMMRLNDEILENVVLSKEQIAHSDELLTNEQRAARERDAQTDLERRQDRDRVRRGDEKQKQEQNLRKIRRQATYEQADLFQKEMGLVQQVAGIYAVVADNVAKTEEQKMKARAIFTAIDATIMTLWETAEAIKSFASQDYWAGAQHTLAAVTYGLTAGFAWAKVGGGGGGVSKPSAAPQQSERQSWSQDRDRRKEAGVVININDQVLSGARAGDTIRQWLEAAEDRRNPARRRKNVNV